jgi:hypothetical protein
MVLSAAGLDDDRCNGGHRERRLDLALGFACCGFFRWQTRLCRWRRCAHDAWGRGWFGELRCRPTEGDWLRKSGPRSLRPGRYLANRRAAVAKRVGAHRTQAQENKYRSALHRSSQPQGAGLRKLCRLCGARVSNSRPFRRLELMT